MTSGEAFRDPGTDYTWLIETSDDGRTWYQQQHPDHGDRGSCGMEIATSAEELALTVLQRQFDTLHDDARYAWDELWFRATVWDHQAAVEWAGRHQPPYSLDASGTTAQTDALHLTASQAEPHAVEVRVPRQVRGAVWQAHVDAVASPAQRNNS